MPKLATHRFFRVLLIGSRRFAPWFEVWGEALRRVGHHPYQLPNPEDGYARERDEFELSLADDAHRQEIQLAQKILVLNVFGYIGPSVLEQVQIAQNLTTDRRIVFLESWSAGESSSRMLSRGALKIPPAYTSPISTVPAPSPYDGELLGAPGPARDRVVRMIKHFESGIYAD